MKDLIEILKQFDVERTKYFGTAQWNEEKVAECFKDCARQILCDGYFLINGKYIIDLGCIELYYHEEEGDIKDPIMYHTNDTGSYSQFFKGKELPYFKFGSFNLHEVGVDVTFEKEKDEVTGEEKKYRASFLIRSYRVFEITDIKELQNIEAKLNNLKEPNFDPHSKHIFDDMFPNGVFIGNDSEYKVEWRTCIKGGGIARCKRRNVAEYENDNRKYKKDDNGNYIKKMIKKEEYDILPQALKSDYKYKGKDKNGTWYFKEEMRIWGFKRIGILEKE